MKYVQNPPPVVIIEGRLTLALPELVQQVVDNAPPFQQPASNARSGRRLLDALDEVDAEGWWKCQDEDWKLLRDTLEKAEALPKIQLAKQAEDGSLKVESVPIATHKLLPLIDAVDQARNTKPVSPKPAKAKSKAK